MLRTAFAGEGNHSLVISLFLGEKLEIAQLRQSTPQRSGSGGVILLDSLDWQKYWSAFSTHSWCLEKVSEIPEDGFQTATSMSLMPYILHLAASWNLKAEPYMLCTSILNHKMKEKRLERIICSWQFKGNMFPSYGWLWFYFLGDRCLATGGALFDPLQHQVPPPCQCLHPVCLRFYITFSGDHLRATVL